MFAAFRTISVCAAMAPVTSTTCAGYACQMRSGTSTSATRPKGLASFVKSHSLTPAAFGKVGLAASW